MPETSSTYYINENEDVLDFLERENITLSDSAIKKLYFISKKTANNYIGYYQFKTDESFIKFFIIPKIHKDIEENKKEENFFKFFSKYYELSDKYSEIDKKSINGNIVDLIFNDFKERNSNTIEEFIRYKYEHALNILDKFFRKHNKTRIRHISYSSQSIENRIDLKRNVLSIDKSNVFQIKKEIESYSKIALIAEQALQRFKKDKICNFTTGSELLHQKSNSILNCIHKKYKVKQGFIFRDRDIITNKIVKLFRKNQELKEVLEALLIIIGLEHYKSEDYSSEVQKLPNMIALFFNPSDLYEWVVYDHLKINTINGAVFNVKEISEEYQLITKKGNYPRFSEPDFIVLENDLITIVDAKWKILENVTDILFADIAKLERDCLIRKPKNKEKMKAQLIYPKVQFVPDEYNPISQSYSPNFKFEIKQVEVK